MKNIGARHIVVDIGLFAAGTLLGSVIIESLKDHRYTRLILGVAIAVATIFFDRRNVLDEEQELQNPPRLRRGDFQTL